MDATEALKRLADADSTLESRKDALTELLSGKVFQKNARSPEVAAAIAEWKNIATNSDTNNTDKLFAVSELVRMAMSAPTLLEQIKSELSEILDSGLPASSESPDAETRFNIARALTISKPDWSAPYAADALANEDRGEKARKEFAATLHGSSEDFKQAIVSLRDAFEKLTHSMRSTEGSEQKRDDTEAAPINIARRMALALDELTRLQATSPINLGKGVGVELKELWKAGTGSVTKSQEQSLITLAKAILASIHVAARSNLQAALDAQTFSSIGAVRADFPRNQWPDELQVDLDVVRADISDAIGVLAKQGVVDRDFLDHLKTLTGDLRKAKLISAAIVAENPEIPELTQYFLRNWRDKPQISGANAAIEETALQQIDGLIANALRRDSSSVISEGDLAEVEQSLATFDPQALQVLKLLHAKSSASSRAINELSKRRRIELFGEVGHVQKASPKYFDSRSKVAQGKVRVPAVIKTDSKGNPAICILKGELE